MELTEALVTGDITPFERERLREALEEDREFAELGLLTSTQ